MRRLIFVFDIWMARHVHCKRQLKRQAIEALYLLLPTTFRVLRQNSLVEPARINQISSTLFQPDARRQRVSSYSIA